jgi:tripartite-type tricarboxylate transporter receptor subunit TctC
VGASVKLPRRNFLHLGASAAALPAIARIAKAATYPTRPIHLIIGFPPGGPNDILARLMGQWLSERLGQPIVVESRPGASGNVGTEVVVRAAPDGYTLYFVNVSNAINATLYEKLPFDFARDIAPVAAVARTPNIMEVPPDFPAKTVSEFIAYAKSNPGNVNFASGGTGTSVHLSGELFKMMTKIDMLHVPYRGSAPALTDLMTGRVQVMFDNIASSVAYIKAEKLRALAVTTPVRSPILPDVPTLSETVPGYDVSAWFGLGAPAKTPSDIVEKLNKETNAVLSAAENQKRIADLGGLVLKQTPEEFGEFVADETAKWAKVIKFANIKPE